MKELTIKEKKQVKAGGIGVYLLIGGLIIFAIGVIDGYVRPLKCNK